MPILKDRMLLAFKEANDTTENGVQTGSETIKFIDAIQNQLVSMCAVKKDAENIPKHQMMNVPKVAKIEDVVKWLNRERIPFELVTEYSNGTQVQHTIKFVTKNILAIAVK